MRKTQKEMKVERWELLSPANLPNNGHQASTELGNDSLLMTHSFESDVFEQGNI